MKSVKRSVIRITSCNSEGLRPALCVPILVLKSPTVFPTVPLSGYGRLLLINNRAIWHCFVSCFKRTMCHITLCKERQILNISDKGQSPVVFRFWFNSSYKWLRQIPHWRSAQLLLNQPGHLKLWKKGDDGKSSVFWMSIFFAWGGDGWYFYRASDGVL